MTYKQMNANIWLYKMQYYADLIKTEKDKQEEIQNRLCPGVANYDEYKGPKDPGKTNAAHTDLLLCYSEQAARIERAQAKYNIELARRREVLEQLPPDLAELAIDIYLLYLPLNELKAKHNASADQIKAACFEILENVAGILANETATAQA